MPPFTPIPYTPISEPVYQAAYEGMLSAFGAGGGQYLTSDDPATYATPAKIAGTWAYEFDRRWQAVTGGYLDSLVVAMIEECSNDYWLGRTPIDRQSPVVTDPNTYRTEIDGIIALITAGEAYLHGSGITPGPAGGPTGPAGPAGATGPAGSPGATGATGGGAGTAVGGILVYRPGVAPAAANIFNDWTLLRAALALIDSEAVVRIDGSNTGGVAHIPGSAGVTDLQGDVTFEPDIVTYALDETEAPPTASVLQLDLGATFTGFSSVRGPLTIQAQCTVAPVIIPIGTGTITLTEGACLKLLAGSTFSLVDTSPIGSLITSGQVSLISLAAGIAVFNMISGGFDPSPNTQVVFAYDSLYLTGLIWNGGTLNFNFDATGRPLLQGSSGDPVDSHATLTNYWISQIPQSTLLYTPNATPPAGPLPYGNATYSWREVMAWLGTRYAAVTDIYVDPSPSGGGAIVPAGSYNMQSVTLHGVQYPLLVNDELTLADGCVLIDLAGLTDGIFVRSSGATTTPIAFVDRQAFTIDQGAILDFIPGTVPCINITSVLSPFQLTVANGSNLTNGTPSAPIGLIFLADAGATLDVGSTNASPEAPPFFGRVFASGEGNGTLNFTHDATLDRPTTADLTLFGGAFVEARATSVAYAQPAAGRFANRPPFPFVGQTYWCTDPSGAAENQLLVCTSPAPAPHWAGVTLAPVV